MTRHYRKLVILFADISKSSCIYECLGDHAAQEAIGRVLTRLSDEATKLRGRVIKTLGDAVMCAFESTDSAVEAGKAMLQATNRPIGDAPDIPIINIHIGIHYGPVIEENDDIFGDAVNVAARVVDYANPLQIVVTRQIIDSLSKTADHASKHLAAITAKNISGEIELFEIVNESQDLTTVLDSRKLAEELCTSLYLTRGEHSIAVDRSRPRISIGRADHNDIVIKYSWISRTHSLIENRNGIILLTDKSTNGVFIYPEDGEPIFLNKSDQPLSGKGIIIFGREKDEDMEGEFDDYVEYVVK
ncbi:MAG TPA: adenylate/guanylate cyclase domain-containing protein [Desulfosalsimonadaceae bacterium]|nr:adenylate/guanylate cyclase domain-containing protein [Desulfosalsimonadaceae bacterium]